MILVMLWRKGSWRKLEQNSDLKSDMISKIVSALGSVPQHVASEDGYEEVTEDFQASRSNGE